jgi:hypothetical protein
MTAAPNPDSRFPNLESTEPVRPMTDDQRFVFDLKGWLLIPAVLNDAQLAAIRAHVEALHADREAMPAVDRSSLAGPAQILLDHPAIVHVLEEILGHNRENGAYGFRCEGGFSTVRPAGFDRVTPPHGGGNNVSPLFSYQCKNGSIYSGLTRVVWELNEVAAGQGGTLFLSGSHKSNFPLPKDLGADSPLFETYSCPPGSVVIFSEAVCHSGAVWTDPRHPRMAIFNAYSRIDTQYHKMSLPLEVIHGMPSRRRTLFRGVWAHDFTRAQPNDYFSDDNHAW